jgi:hypothetical protein
MLNVNEVSVGQICRLGWIKVPAIKIKTPE